MDVIGGYIQQFLTLCFAVINYMGTLFVGFLGDFGALLILGLGTVIVVYRFLIKPITGYGVGSDSARPKKDEKGE